MWRDVALGHTVGQQQAAHMARRQRPREAPARPRGQASLAAGSGVPGACGRLLPAGLVGGGACRLLPLAGAARAGAMPGTSARPRARATPRARARARARQNGASEI